MVTPTPRTYLICSTPRSGSTMLAFGLGSTKIAGNPNEYLDANVVFNWAQQYNLSIRSYADYLQQLMRVTCTENGIFGAKTMWHSIQDTLAVYARTMPDLAPLPLHHQVNALLNYPKYLFITRNDKLRQAISLVKATQTNIWIHWNGSSGQNAAPAAEPMYNAAAIEEQLNTVIWVEKVWESFFSLAGIQPYRVVYEDLVERYEAIILDILQYLNIDLPPGFRVPAPVTAQQADRVSDEWVERFMNEPKSKRAFVDAMRVHERVDKLLQEENEMLRRQRDDVQSIMTPYQQQIERLTTENNQLHLALSKANDEIARLRAQPVPYIELLARNAYRNTVPHKLRLRLRDLRQGLRTK
jgi:trehalose 2-sulfotransferase